MKIDKDLRIQIVKGKVADYAIQLADLENLTNDELSKILAELAIKVC